MTAESQAILILAATARDAALAAQALESSHIESQTCTDIQSLETSLAQGVGAVLVAEEACSPDVLQVLENHCESQAPWSDLPLVFLQVPRAAGDSPIVARLRSCGNLSLLERPLRQSTLLSAMETALRARRRQYEVRDLIEEKEADVRGRDEFLAMLGHELRNPLAAIRYAISLLDEIDDDETTRTPREVIGRQTSHLAHLVDDLLDVARVTRGKISLDKRPVDLNELARKTLEGLEVARIDGQHEILFNPFETPLMVEGDAVRIEQIFSNLLFNAVKYTPPGGRIVFTLCQEEGIAMARLEDNGIGMSRELLSRVFDLFSQAQHSIDRSRGGLGIGLTLVRGLVELHGGRISAKSDGVGQGSTFEVRLPLLVQAPQQNDPQNLAPESGQRRVLLVEDNEDAREVLKLLLERGGHAVECATDGSEGIEKAIQIQPEIALVDIGLPVFDGYEVAARIRRELGSSIFLVALTGYGQPEDRQRALEAGFDEHLTKPVELERLRDLLRRIPAEV